MVAAVLVLLVLVVVVVMVAAVLVLLVLVMVMMVMVVALAVGIVTLVLIVVMMVVFVLLRQLLQLTLQQVLLHDLKDLRAAELIPGGGDQTGGGVDALEQFHGGGGLGAVGGVCAAEDDQIGARHLIVEKFSEVAGVHFALSRVYHGGFGSDCRAVDALDRVRYVGELADAGRLDQDAVGRIVGHDLGQRLGEVAHERAADAAGIHFGDLHAGVLQERAVHRDLAELVFDQNELFILIALGDQLSDQRGFACSEKSGKNIDFSQ